MKNIASCVERQHFTQDKFQTYICWMLLAGAVFAMIPPIITVVINQTNGGCIGTEFVVYAHYSTHEWLTEKFNEFKFKSSTTFDDKICYKLRIEDSALVDDVNPSIWIPETAIWIDIAEDRLKRTHPDKLTDGKLIMNRTADCTSTTTVPFGIITWKKLAALISPDHEPVPFTHITELAEDGWVDFTNNSIKNVYPKDVKSLFIAHGHPNVTSGGLLGFLTAFSSLLDISAGDVVKYASPPPDCTAASSENGINLDNVTEEIGALEKKVIATAPIDYTLPGFMMSRGPKYLHMAYGFENDVALLNEKYKDQLMYLWNDTLAFLYLEETYWIEHPMCKLTGASWYDPKKAEVAEAFVKWVTSPDLGNIADLEKYGLRPFKTKINSSTSIISEENGCNLKVKPSFLYKKPTVVTSDCMRAAFQDLKKNTRLMILLDVSGNMQSSISDTETRWAQVSSSLPILAEHLESAAMITLTCFHDFILEGPGCSSVSYPNGTLSESRASLMDYFANSIAPKIGEDSVNLFTALNETYKRVNITQTVENNKFRYIILVITEDDNSDDKELNAISLLNNIGLDFNPNQIHFYPILYYGTEGGTTFSTLKDIADRTNGQFSTATADTLADVLTEFTYYW